MPRPAVRVPATALAVTAIVSVQVGAAIARQTFDVVGPVGAAFVRLLLATVILIAIIRPPVRRWTAAMWRAALFYGLALGGMNVFIYLSLDRIPLGVAVTVEFLGPLALALSQMRRWRDAAWAVLALVGVLLLGVRGVGTLDPVGLLFALAAAACWGCYIVFSARVGRVLPGVSGLPVAMAIATIVALPFGIRGAAQALPEPGILLALLAVAVLSSAVPYALELVALRRIPTRVFGVIQSLGPAMAALSGLVLLGQALHLAEIVALVLISAASVGITVGSRAPRSPLPPPPASPAPASPATVHD